MHKIILNISIIILMTLGVAAAQDSAGHRVNVSIPNVLKLRLDNGTNTSSASVPIDIQVENGNYRIDPAYSELQIFANSNWQLSASYSPDSTNDAQAQLTWRMNDRGSWQDFTAYPRVLSSGEKTQGWQSLSIAYGLKAPLPTDGNYSGVVTYTLARP